MPFFLPCAMWHVITVVMGEGESDVGNAGDGRDLLYSIFDAVFQGVLYGQISRNPHLMRGRLTIVMLRSP